MCQWREAGVALLHVLNELVRDWRALQAQKQITTTAYMNTTHIVDIVGMGTMGTFTRSNEQIDEVL